MRHSYSRKQALARAALEFLIIKRSRPVKDLLGFPRHELEVDEPTRSRARAQYETHRVGRRERREGLPQRALVGVMLLFSAKGEPPIEE